VQFTWVPQAECSRQVHARAEIRIGAGQHQYAGLVIVGCGTKTHLECIHHLLGPPIETGGRVHRQGRDTLTLLHQDGTRFRACLGYISCHDHLPIQSLSHHCFPQTIAIVIPLLIGLFVRRIGARTVRLLNGRFRLDLTDELVLPRTKDGDIDIRGTTELVTGIVEGWVREHPEQ